MVQLKNKDTTVGLNDAKKYRKDMKFYKLLFARLQGKADNEHAFSLGEEGANEELEMIGGGEANALRAVACLLCQRFPVL